MQKSIRFLDIGSRPQSIGLSDIGLRKYYRLPTSAQSHILIWDFFCDN